MNEHEGSHQPAHEKYADNPFVDGKEAKAGQESEEYKGLRSKVRSLLTSILENHPDTEVRVEADDGELYPYKIGEVPAGSRIRQRSLTTFDRSTNTFNYFDLYEMSSNAELVAKVELARRQPDAAEYWFWNSEKDTGAHNDQNRHELDSAELEDLIAKLSAINATIPKKPEH